MRRLLILALLAVVLGTASVTPTQAHGYIVRSIPEDRTTLERAPTRLQYWFSEALEPQFSEINLRDQEGNVIATGGVPENDDTLLVVRPPSTLPDGAYIVDLRPAFASDGHVIIQSQVFFVGEEVAGVEGQAASTTARPLEVVWKSLLYNSTYLIFGVIALYLYVLVPVWGNEKYPAGLLPPRVMRHLNRILWGSLAVAISANGLALFQQTMIFFGVGLADVLTGGLWNVVRIGSRFGDVWNFRMVGFLLLAVFHGLSLYYASRHPRTVRSFWSANIWVVSLLLGAQAVNSHAAGSLVLPWVAIFVQWLHIVAVAFWVGGIAALALVLPVALQPYKGEARWQALRPLMNRFSRYAVGALIVVIASGVFNATVWFFTPSDLVTTYGAALATKIAMVGLLLLVAALHHVALRPHLLNALPFQGLVTWAQQFGVSLRVETVFAALTLTLAALLSATPIPEPEFTQVEIETPIATQSVDDLQTQLTISPGGPGVNTYDAVVYEGGAPLDNLQIEMQHVAPERGFRSPWLATDPAEDGLYVAASASIDQPGRWWTLVNVRHDDATVTRFAYEWQISDAASVIERVPPSPWTVAAALSVLASVIYVLLPAMRRLANRMDWSATNVVISVGVIVMTTGLLWGSVVFIRTLEVRIEADRNPPPVRVNAVLPTQESIEMGETLYLEHCIQWQTKTDFQALLNQLDLLRDEDLYAITERGWRDLPACEGELSERQRWHIVNYTRTLRDRR